MRIFTFAIVSLFFCCSTTAQSEINDQGVRDTIALNISTTEINQSDSVLSLEVWVYSDETILSFSGRFKWNNSKIRLNSAELSPYLESLDLFSYFFYEEDDLTKSNTNQTFVLGGITSSNVLEGDVLRRRHWATYYFTMNNWSHGDSVNFDTLSSPQVELMFIRSGPFYPVSFQPVFAGPMKFPGIETDILDTDPILPANFVLYQNFPNPFNPKTTIQFELEKSALVDLSVFNLLGQEVSSVYQGRLPAGLHRLSWEAISNEGQKLPSGTYLYRLQNGEISETKKMLLIR